VEQTAQRHLDPPAAGRILDHPHVPSSSVASWEPAPTYGSGSGSGTAYALVASSIPPRPPTQVSPRANRKTKAHVASACVNCKRKHLRCDESRPCRRCVQSGKEVRQRYLRVLTVLTDCRIHVVM